MTKRTQVSTIIAKDIKQMLQHMAVNDQVSIRNILERLITQEYNRRKGAGKLVDTRADARREAEKETG